MRLYLADLGHNLVTATSDTYPLGVGNLATFAKAYAKSPTPIEVAVGAVSAGVQTAEAIAQQLHAAGESARECAEAILAAASGRAA